VGVLIYWLTTNVWTLGQQMYVIKRNPTPGSIAFNQRQERLRKKGKLVEEPAAPEAKKSVEGARAARTQPKKLSKAQRQAGGGQQQAKKQTQAGEPSGEASKQAQSKQASKQSQGQQQRSRNQQQSRNQQNRGQQARKQQAKKSQSGKSKPSAKSKK
jgi:YidC/Oxa1 family membrane protein insertase